MQQILIYGRGGQGAKLAGELIISSLFSQGRTVQGMPLYTGAKMGQPLVYSVKIDPNSDRAMPTSHIDGIMVMHANMLTKDVTAQTASDCFILINSPHSPEFFAATGPRVACVDANRIAREHGLVRANVPTVSTVMAGAFTRVSGLFPFAAIELAMCDYFKRNAELNVEVAQRGFQEVRQFGSDGHG